MKPKRKPTKSKLFFSIVPIIAALGLGGWMLVRNGETPISVKTEKVQERDITETVIANGRIQPVVQVKISPEVSGEIIELPVREGDTVKKGDLLLRIRPDFYQANRNSAEASYRASLANRDLAMANLEKAQIEFRRVEALFSDRFVSESALLEAKTIYQVAEASFRTSEHQVDVAKAALARAEEEFSKTTIHAPMDGTVSKLNSELGERVVGTALMTGTEVMIVADLNEMEALVDVGETDVTLIELGQQATLEVDAFKDRKFKGTVTEIANSSKAFGMPGSGGQQQEAIRFEVKIHVDEKAAFRPGMSVTAEIKTRSKTNVLAVPILSITTRILKPDDHGVSPGDRLAAKPSDAADAEKEKPVEVLFLVEGDQVRAVPVQLGISDDSYWEITHGVRAGDEVVSGPFQVISRELEHGKKIVREVDLKPKSG